MKDKRAVTTQTISVPFPRVARPTKRSASSLKASSFERATRHGHKLKPGHLKGNRFAIALARPRRRRHARASCATLEEAGRRGVPNAFGPQRFGRDGDNPERALAWLAGPNARPQGPPRATAPLLGAAVGALQPRLGARQTEGTWDRPARRRSVEKV